MYTVGNWSLRINFQRAKSHVCRLGNWKKQVNTDLDLLVNIVDGQMTVCELVGPIFENKDRSKAKHETGICYSAEITCKGSIWQKDDTKCANFRCKAVPYQIAAGRWKKLQFHSYHPGSAATSLFRWRWMMTFW